jgi:subtilase-type serine protease
MQGIAYNATVYDYKTDNDGDMEFEGVSTDASRAAIYNRHVTDNINVSNNSWGSGYTIGQVSEATIRSWDSNTITALRAAQNNGTLFVFAAGNSGNLTTQTTQPSYTGAMPYRITELADEWLLVVSVDKNLQEAKWTQRCGYAWSFCVAAVGGAYDNTASATAVDGIYAAQANTGGYVRASGTSMAAPQVSGIAALLMEKFPSLTPAQIATRIKSTASMSGLYTKYGNLVTGFSTSYQRTVFGNGLVNASSAAAMIGTPTYPLGENYYEGVAELSGDPLSLPSWISGSAASEVLNSSFTVFDSFDGARFDVTGSTVFTASNSPTSSETVAEFIGKTSDKSVTDSVQMFTLNDNSKMSFFSPSKLGPSKDYWGTKASLFSTNDAFKPKTSLGMQFVSDTKTGHAVSFVEVGEDSQDFVAGTQLTYTSDVSGTSVLAGLDMTKNKISTALLSSETDELKTYGVHFGLQQRVGNNWSVFLKGSQRDLSDVAHSENKWGFQNAKLNHYAAGIEYDHGSTNFVVGVQEPEEIASGTLNFTAPTGRHRDGQIIWQDRSFSFGGQNHRPLFTSFGTNVGKSGKVKMSLSEDHHHSGKLGDVKLGYSLQF